MKQPEKIAEASASLKAVAAFTLIAFIFTQTAISTPTAFAQNLNVSGGDPFSVSTAEVTAANRSTDPASGGLNGMLAVPSELGEIEESFQGTSAKTILFIQDAHDSLEVQENIAKLIDWFVKENGIKTVFEEGYEGQVPTDDFFGFIGDSNIKQKVSYFLLDKLRLGGAEYAHVNRTQDFDLIGVDSLNLYSENIKAYQDSSKNRKEIEADLTELFAQILGLANQYFPKELKYWLRLKERVSEGKLPLLDYLKELRRLLLLAKRGHLNTGSASEFAETYPALSILLVAETTKDKQLIAQLNSLDSKIIFKEITSLEQELSNTFLQNNRDKQIFDYYQGLRLLKRLNQIQLTQSEYAAAKEILQSLDTRKLADFIVSLTHKPLLLSRAWERHIRDAIRFYKIANDRDRSLASALDKYFLADRVESLGYRKTKTQGKLSPESYPQNPNVAVLVFGGFHATAIKDLLREKGLNYVVVSPRITKIEKRHQDYYKQLMSIGHLPFEAPFLVTRATKQPGLFHLAATGQDSAVRAELRAIVTATVTLGEHSDPQLITKQLGKTDPFDRSEIHSGPDEEFLAEAARSGLQDAVRSEVRSKTEWNLDKLARENFLEQLARKNGKFETLGRDDGVERMGWVDIVDRLAEDHVRLGQVKREAETIRQNYKHVVLIGMGLRSAEVALALRKDNLAPEIHILETTDIGEINKLLKKLDISVSDRERNQDALKKTLFIGISKGGTTFEVLRNLDYFRRLLASHRIDPIDNMWVMTDPGSPMAESYGAAGFKVLTIQLDGKTDIGGRFAAPGTRIFLLTAAVRGQDPELLLKQAASRTESSNVSSEKGRENFFLKLAAMLVSVGGAGKVSNLIVCLPEELKPAWKWIEAIFEETLGKKGAGVMVWDGDRVDPNAFNSNEHPAIVLNVRVESSEGNDSEIPGRIETLRVLEERGVQEQELLLRSKRELVSLIEGLKTTVAAVGYLWDVNIINQPVHQRNKTALHEWNPSTPAVLTAEVFDPVRLSEQISNEREYVEMRFYGQPTPEEWVELDELKRVVEKHALVPTKISIAPAADHATLQRMSEGPQNSVVIIFARPEPEITVGEYEDGLNMRFALQAYHELQKAGRAASFINLQKSDKQSAYQLRDLKQQLIFHMSGHITSANFSRKIKPILLRLKHQGHLTPDGLDAMDRFKSALRFFERELKPATPDAQKLELIKDALQAVGIGAAVLSRRSVVSPDGQEIYPEVRYLKVQFMNEDWILGTGSGPLHWRDYGLTFFPMRFIKHSRDLFWFYDSHEILPSILEVHPQDRQALLNMAMASGITHFHIDQADGKFVKRVADNIAAVKTVRELLPSAFVEAHLMVSGAGLKKEVDRFIRAGVQRIYFHIEAFQSADDLKEFIRSLHQQGIQVGLTLNPDTKADVIEPFLSMIDAVLIMDVVPGGGGRQFIPEVLTKTLELYQKVQKSGYYIDLISDGGIGLHTSKLVIRHGADDVVTGAFIFGKPNEPYDITSSQNAINRLQDSMFDTRQKIIEENVHFARASGDGGYVLLRPRPVVVSGRKIRYPRLLQEEFITDAENAQKEFLKHLQENMQRSWQLYDDAINHRGPFYDALVITTKESTAEINRHRIEELRGIAYPAATPVVLIVEPEGLLRDSLSGVVNAAIQGQAAMKELGLDPKRTNVLLIQMAGEASRNRPLSSSVVSPGKQWIMTPSGQTLFERTIFESLQFFDPDQSGWSIRAIDQAIGVGILPQEILAEPGVGYTTFGAYYPEDKFPLRFQAVKTGSNGEILWAREKPEPSEASRFANESGKIASTFFVRRFSHEAMQGLIENFRDLSSDRGLPFYVSYHLNESFHLLDAANFSENEEKDLEAWTQAYFNAKGGSFSRSLPVLFPDYLKIREAALDFRRKYGMAFRSIGDQFVFEDTGTNRSYFDIFLATLRSKALQILYDVMPNADGDIVVDSDGIGIKKQNAKAPHFIVNSHDVSGTSSGPLVMVGIGKNVIDVGPDTLVYYVPDLREVIRSPGGMLESFAIIERNRFRISYPLGANPQQDMMVKRFGPGGKYSLEDLWQEVKSRSRGRSELREIEAPGIDLIVFDMDGTLYNSPALLQAYRNAAYELYRSRFGGGFGTARNKVEGRRRALREQGKPYGDRDVLESLGFNYEEKIANEARRINVTTYLKPDLELQSLLKNLRRRYRLVLSTNNTDRMTAQILEALGLTGFFEKIYTQQSTGIHKPDPKIFELIQKDMGVPFSKMVSVGDRIEADIDPAERLGISGIWVKGPIDLVTGFEERLSSIEARLIASWFTAEANVPRWRDVIANLASVGGPAQKVSLIFDSAAGRMEESFSFPVGLMDALLDPVLVPYISALLNNRAMTIGFDAVYITGLPRKAQTLIRAYVKKHFDQIDGVSRDYDGRIPRIKFTPAPAPGISLESPKRLKVAGAFRSDQGTFIGANVGQTDIKFSLIVKGEFKKEWTLSIPTWTDSRVRTFPGIYEGVVRGIGELLSKAGIGLDQIDGIGLSVGGIVKEHRMTTRSGIAYGMSDEDFEKIQRISEILSAQMNCPVILDQDVVSKGIALVSRYHLKKTLVLDLGTSLGSLYIDADGAIPVQVNQSGRVSIDLSESSFDRPDKRGKGVLTQYLSGTGLANMGVRNGLEEIKNHRITELLKSGDKKAQAVLKSMTENLLDAARELSRYYDFDSILLTGGLINSDFGEALLQGARMKLQEEGIGITLIKSELDPTFEGAIGAADLANWYVQNGAARSESRSIPEPTYRNLREQHQFFADLEIQMPKDELIRIFIKFSDTYSREFAESFSVPGAFFGAHPERVFDYAATLVASRILFAGAVAVDIETLSAGKVSAEFLPYLVNLPVMVAKYLEDHFGKTQDIDRYLRFLQQGISAFWEQHQIKVGLDIPVPFDPDRVSGKDAIGVDIGGTNIKYAVFKNGQVVDKQEASISEISGTVGEHIAMMLNRLTLEHGLKMSNQHKIYVTAPGIIMFGSPWILPNLEVRWPGSLQSLRDLQNARPEIEYISDSKAAAYFIAAEQRISDHTIINTLGTGLGLSIIRNGKIEDVPSEAHIRWDQSEQARWNSGYGFKGDLESYANAEFVVNRFNELVRSQRPNFKVKTSKQVGEVLEGEDSELAFLAQQVFLEFGKHLTVLYGEIARVLGQNEWDVILTGGIAKGAAGEGIIRGVREGLSHYPDLNIKSIVIPGENQFGGALGAAYLGVSGYHWKQRSEMRVLGKTPRTWENGPHVGSLAGFLRIRKNPFRDLHSSITGVRSELPSPMPGLDKGEMHSDERFNVSTLMRRSEVGFASISNRIETRLWVNQIARKIRANRQPATVFLDAEDWGSFSEEQKQEYFFLALSRSETSIIVYNERGQVKDKDLAALLKLDRVERTEGDLGRTVRRFAKPHVPAIHLSKELLPSEAEIHGFRGKVAFFKAIGNKSGILATALLWAISGGESIRFQGVRKEDVFWTVDEPVLDAIRRTYESNFIIAIAA